MVFVYLNGKKFRELDTLATGAITHKVSLNLINCFVCVVNVSRACVGVDRILRRGVRYQQFSARRPDPQPVPLFSLPQACAGIP